MRTSCLPALLIPCLLVSGPLHAQSGPPADSPLRTSLGWASPFERVTTTLPAAVPDAGPVTALPAVWQRLINQGPRGPGRYLLSWDSRDPAQFEVGSDFYIDVPGYSTFTFLVPIGDPPGSGAASVNGAPPAFDPPPEMGPNDLFWGSPYPGAPLADPFLIPLTPQDHPAGFGFSPETLWGPLYGSIYNPLPARQSQYFTLWYDPATGTFVDPPDQPAPEPPGPALPPERVRQFDLGLEQGLLDAADRVEGERTDGGFLLDPNDNPMSNRAVGTLLLTRDATIYRFDLFRATLEALDGENMGRVDRLDIATGLYDAASEVHEAYEAMNDAWDVVMGDYDYRYQFLPGDRRNDLLLSPTVMIRADARYEYDMAAADKLDADGNHERAQYYRDQLAANPYPDFLEKQARFFELLNQQPILGIKRDTYWPNDEAYFFEELIGLEYGPEIDTFDERQGLLGVFDEFRTIGIQNMTELADEARGHTSIDDLMTYAGATYSGVRGEMVANAEQAGFSFPGQLMDETVGSYQQYKAVKFANDMERDLYIAGAAVAGSVLLPGGVYIAAAYGVGDVGVQTYDVIDVTLETGQMERMAVVTGFQTLGGRDRVERQAWGDLYLAVLFGAADVGVAARSGRGAAAGAGMLDEAADALTVTRRASDEVLEGERAFWRSVTPPASQADLGIQLERLDGMVERALQNGVPSDRVAEIVRGARAGRELTVEAVDAIDRQLIIAWANANDITVLLPVQRGAVRLDETPPAMLWLDFTEGAAVNATRQMDLVMLGEIKAAKALGQELTEEQLRWIRTQILPHGDDALNWFEFTAGRIETPQGTRLAGGLEQTFDEELLDWMRRQAGSARGPGDTQILRPEEIQPWLGPAGGGGQAPNLPGFNTPPPAWGAAVRDPTGNYLPLSSVEEYAGLVARQDAGEIIDLGNIARPGIANVTDEGRIAVQQGAGRWEKTRPDQYLDLFVRADSPLPSTAVVVEEGISPELVKQANILSSRGREGANPIFVNAVVDDGATYIRIRVPASEVVAPTSRIQFEITEILERLGQQGEDMAELNAILSPLSPAERLDFLQRVEAAGGLQNVTRPDFGALGPDIGTPTLPYPHQPGEIVPAMPTNLRMAAALEEEEFQYLAGQQLQQQINLTGAAGISDSRIWTVVDASDDPVRQAQDLALTRLWHEGFQLEPTIPLGQPLTPLAQEARDLTGVYVRFRDGIRNRPPDQPPIIANETDFNWLRDRVWSDPYYFQMTTRRGFYNLENDPLVTPLLQPGAASELNEAFWNTVRQQGEMPPRPGTFGGPGTSDPGMMFPLSPVIDLTTTRDALDYGLLGEAESPLTATITSTGNSTGPEAFEIQIVNLGKPVRLRAEAPVFEPIEEAEQGQSDNRQGFAAWPSGPLDWGGMTARNFGPSSESESATLLREAPQETITVTVGGYCLEKELRPPAQGELYRLASVADHERFAPARRVLSVSRRLLDAGVFEPDTPGDPEGYFHSIRQWAIWTIEQGYDEAEFADAFVDHARENFEAAGQSWTDEIEEAVRPLLPARWQAIQRVVQEVSGGSDD